VDCYRELQVHPDAETDTITVVYRYLAKRYHPDVVPAAQKAVSEARMKTINAAYAVLSDAQSRRDYDACRPTVAVGSNRTADRFAVADALVEVARAGGCKQECFERGVAVLRQVVLEHGDGPVSDRALQMIAEVQLTGLTDYSQAVETLGAILNRTAKGPDRDGVLLLIAQCHVRLGRHSQALAAYEEACRECVLPETMLRARVEAADVLAALGRAQDALDAFAVIVATYGGTDPAAYAQYRIGRILDSDMQRYPEAISAYRRVLVEHGTSEWARDCQWRIDHIQRKHIDKKAWWE